MSSTINGAGLFSHSYARALTQMRQQFDDLIFEFQQPHQVGGLDLPLAR